MLILKLKFDRVFDYSYVRLDDCLPWKKEKHPPSIKTTVEKEDWISPVGRNDRVQRSFSPEDLKTV